MTSRTSTSAARASTITTAAAAAKPPCSIASMAVIADKAQLVGSHAIEIGENCVLHPYARVRAEGGWVRIGRDVTVSETAVVGLLALSAQGGDAGSEDEDVGVVIGDGVSIGSGAEVLAKCVGEHTVIEGKVKIGPGAVVGRFCKIAPLNVIKAGEQLPDFTVVYGDNQRRVDEAARDRAEIREARVSGHAMEIDLLKKLIPNAAEKWR